MSKLNRVLPSLCQLCCLTGYLIGGEGFAAAHSMDEIQQTFAPGPVPKELLEATQQLEVTAGQKSTREDAHHKQHSLLEQYVRALRERKCTEAMADISRFDEAIIDFRDKANSEEEHKIREARDNTAAIIKEECRDLPVP